MTMLLAVFLKMQNLLQGRIRTALATARDRGGVTVEWAALGIFVVAVVAGAAEYGSDIGEEIKNGMGDLIDSLFGDEGGLSTPAEED